MHGFAKIMLLGRKDVIAEEPKRGDEKPVPLPVLNHALPKTVLNLNIFLLTSWYPIIHHL